MLITASRVLLLIALMAPLGAGEVDSREVRSTDRKDVQHHASDSFTPVGGGIEVDLKNKVIRMPIELVNKGNEKDPSRSIGLEFLVTIGKDKDYEAMFSSEARGQHLHMALLMIGLEPSSSAKVIPATSNLHIDIQLGQDRLPAHAWVVRSDQRPVEDLHWYFRGSELIKEGERSLYAADEPLNLIATMPAPSMVVGPGVDVGNPYNMDEVYLVPALVPDVPLGTKGWVWIQSR